MDFSMQVRLVETVSESIPQTNLADTGDHLGVMRSVGLAPKRA
jgi:hypothetical protein